MKTPQENFPELAAALGVPEVWLKREDLHHFGSHKGRSIPYMMDHYWHKEKKHTFVVSSSGNAALAAALYTRHHNANNPDKKINLKIFVGQHIAPEKLARLEQLTDAEISLTQTDNAKQAAFAEAKNGAVWLRQSTDDLALKGYHELTKELDHIPNLQAIFVPTSSGTTAQALAQAFLNLDQKPEVHIVQTAAVHPIADSFQNPLCPTFAKSVADPETSLAGAIVDKVAHRKFAVLDAVLKTNGSGWIATDDDIRKAATLAKTSANLDISPNSALSIAGLTLATRAGKKFSGAVVCLVTGA